MFMHSAYWQVNHLALPGLDHQGKNFNYNYTMCFVRYKTKVDVISTL